MYLKLDNRISDPYNRARNCKIWPAKTTGVKTSPENPNLKIHKKFLWILRLGFSGEV
jgi:hypothetical protein